MRISDWSSDVCSSDLRSRCPGQRPGTARTRRAMPAIGDALSLPQSQAAFSGRFKGRRHAQRRRAKTKGERQHDVACRPQPFSLARKGERLKAEGRDRGVRSEEHTSEIQSLMRISYAVFCLKKKKKT